MLRPERMSRVSVTGSKRVMDETIDAVHDMRLLHVTGYGDDWDGFRPGDPMEGADDASEKLVTVRSLQSILDVEGEEAGPARLVTEDALDDELEDIRVEVNELDDRRDHLRDELRTVEERIDSMEPFASLGIDMDLLSGYDTIDVAVGTGDSEAVRRTLVEAECDFEVYEADDGSVMAVFGRTHTDDDLDDILVGTQFQQVDVPDAEGSPEEYLSELEARRQQLEGKLTTVQDQLDELRLEVGGFLLAAEETLAIAVQQQEAPLDFATTDNAFVAEGWIPTERFVDLAEGLHEAVGDHVEVDELERAEYDGEGRIVSREDVGGAPNTPEPTAAGDGGRVTDDEAEREEVATDGGHATARDAGDQPMSTDSPPVIQDNPGPVKPFESLVEVINRPRYSELDPTVFLFLTFPLFFGLMIGDLGYGILYIALGYYLYTGFDSEVIRSLGGVGILAGIFTAIFGVVYGEIFGLHILGEVVWVQGLGMKGPPLHKGLQPHYIDYAFFWLVMSLLFGLAHLTIGYALDFYEKLGHGLGHAIGESGSWLMMMFGVWVWIFSYAVAGSKPEFLVGEASVFNGNPIALGFTGFPAIVGWVGLAVFFVGLVLLAYTEVIEAVEALNVLVNVLSYTRLTAVLLAKAGMAFVVNLLVLGAYQEEGEYHYIFMEGGEVHGEVLFPGMINGGGVELVVGALAGIVILVLGHGLVLVLGITSAGLQAVRLEYVEFFSKFYEGGGDEYEPFGYERRFTTDD